MDLEHLLLLVGTVANIDVELTDIIGPFELDWYGFITLVV